MSRAMLLIKQGSAKHRGMLYYINRNKKLGIHPPKKGGKEFIKSQRALKKAKMMAKARGRG